MDHSAVVATDLDASSAFYHMLGLERIDALLNEAGLLQWTAQNRLAAGDVAEASRMLEQARLLAEDAATYVLPSGMHLAVRALLTALDRQLMSLSAIPRRGCT